jgi:hypothetical protein
MTTKEPQRTEFPPKLDHPCKQTCSGWKQGYDAGLAERNARIAEKDEKIKHLTGALREVDEINEHAHDKLTAANAAIAELERKLKVATDALSKYASCYDSDECRFEEDCGVYARKALDAVRGRG